MPPPNSMSPLRTAKNVPGCRPAVCAKNVADASMPGPSNHPKSRRDPW